RGVAETIHVVEGEFEMEIDGQRSRLSAGETIHVPADVAHSGGNVGEAWGRRIVMFSPAGMEQFFRDAGAPSEDAEVEPTAALAVAVRHGWKFTSELLTERGLELSAEGRPQLVRACTSSIPGLTCRVV